MGRQHADSDETINSTQLVHLLSLREIARGLVHEVNNRLTIILSAARVLQMNADRRTLDKAIVDEWTASIETSCNALIETIASLVTIGRSSQGEPIQRCTLAEIADTINSLCVGNFKKHAIKLTITIDEGLRSTPLQLVRGKFCQVLLNLLVHARQQVMALPKKAIALTFEYDREHLTVRCSDRSGLAALPPAGKAPTVGDDEQFLCLAAALIQELGGSLQTRKVGKNREYFFKIQIGV